jgi:hypothetical protein
MVRVDGAEGQSQGIEARRLFSRSACFAPPGIGIDEERSPRGRDDLNKYVGRDCRGLAKLFQT